MSKLIRLCVVTTCLCAFAIGCSPPDACQSVECNGHGECAEGDCVCDIGYEGIDCLTLINAKFDGTYSNVEECDSAVDSSYTVTISPTPNSLTQIGFTGLFGRSSTTVFGSLDQSGLNFAIERQGLGSSGLEIEGEGLGNSSGEQVSIVYWIYPVGGSTAIDSCRALMQR